MQVENIKLDHLHVPNLILKLDVFLRFIGVVSILVIQIILVLLLVPDIPLYLGVLKHRIPSSCHFSFTIDFCLFDAILNLKVFCFGATGSHENSSVA